MNNPIRILHVFGALDMGGAETLVMNIYRKIDRTKVQFDFIKHTNKVGVYEDEIKSLGGKVYSIDSFNGANYFKYKKQWNVFFKQHPEYKIIHGHVRSTAAAYLKIAKRYGLITISHSHNTSSGVGISSIVKDVMQYPIRYIADYFFACSDIAGKWLFGERIVNKNDAYRLIKNGIDIDSFIYNNEIRNTLRNQLNIQDKFVIGHIGRFTKQKNHSFLIDIFYEVYKIKKNAVLLLVGTGELEEAIKEKVKRLGIEENVIFAGTTRDANVFYQAMDVFVFPSLFEGLGIVVIEAQASGLHCIVSEEIPREAYITDLIEKMYLKDSAYKWAEKILQYNCTYEHKSTYEEIKKSGYDIKGTADYLVEFYTGINNS